MLGDVEDGVASILTCELNDHLPGANHLARLGAGCGDRARRVGEQDRIALLFPRDPDLRLGGVDLGLGAQELLLRLVKIGARRPAILQELLLPPEGEARLRERRLERREIGFRRAQRIVRNLGVQLRHQLAGLEHIAHMDRPLDHPPVQPEGQASLVLWADVTRQGYDLPFRAMLDGDRPDKPGFRGHLDRLVATREGHGHQGGCD